MLRSAQNFAEGFFGHPADEQYNLEVMIESPSFNNTLAPWSTVSYIEVHSYTDDLISAKKRMRHGRSWERSSRSGMGHT